MHSIIHWALVLYDIRQVLVNGRPCLRKSVGRRHLYLVLGPEFDSPVRNANHTCPPPLPLYACSFLRVPKEKCHKYGPSFTSLGSRNGDRGVFRRHTGDAQLVRNLVEPREICKNDEYKRRRWHRLRAHAARMEEHASNWAPNCSKCCWIAGHRT